MSTFHLCVLPALPSESDVFVCGYWPELVAVQLRFTKDLQVGHDLLQNTQGRGEGD